MNNSDIKKVEDCLFCKNKGVGVFYFSNNSNFCKTCNDFAPSLVFKSMKQSYAYVKKYKLTLKDGWVINHLTPSKGEEK